MALEGETIASALFANGIRIFGHHPQDGSPQGIFCANGLYGQGFMLGPGLGELLCRMVQGRTTPDDTETLAILSPYREFKGMEPLK